jgi:restriction system protein
MALIETENLSLADWLTLLNNPPKNAVYVDYMFPSDRHRDEYLSTVQERNITEVKQLLRRFLWLPTSFGEDTLRAEILVQKINNKEPIKDTELHRRVKYYIASRGKLPIWDGTQWVLDLLPKNPRECLQTFEAYVGLYGFPLPDGRFHGIIDAMSVIRSKFIDIPISGKEFDSISDRQLELLIAVLYDKIGFSAIVTKKTRAGGRDVIAERNEPGKRERLLIEVKHHAKPIGVSVVRALLGVVSSEKVNKGVLITTSTFTRDAALFAKSNPRIELIDCNQIVKLLNKYLGSTWSNNFYQIISDRIRNDKNES